MPTETPLPTTLIGVVKAMVDLLIEWHDAPLDRRVEIAGQRMRLNARYDELFELPREPVVFTQRQQETYAYACYLEDVQPHTSGESRRQAWVEFRDALEMQSGS